VSSHWNPDSEIARIDSERERRRAWPAGATAGLALVAILCVATSALLYEVSAPRDVFAEVAPGN
jgi:hypothetical protein